VCDPPSGGSNARGSESESATCIDVPTDGGVLARGERHLPGVRMQDRMMRALSRLSRRTRDIVRTHATRASSARTPSSCFLVLGFSANPFPDHLSLRQQAQLGGKDSPSEADVKAVLASGTWRCVIHLRASPRASRPPPAARVRTVACRAKPRTASLTLSPLSFQNCSLRGGRRCQALCFLRRHRRQGCR